jgi:ribosomal protein S18 acetylase RimI-like enzyme
MSNSVSLRPSTKDDQEFLLRVYAGTRQEEMALWSWSATQQSAFLSMQYEARKHSYSITHPSAEVRVIYLGDEPIGSIIVSRSSVEIRLVDIELLPQHRNGGIGTRLIRELIAESRSAKLPLRLNVLGGNRAKRLYERLGFALKTNDAMYCEMEFRDSRVSSTDPAAEASSHVR